MLFVLKSKMVEILSELLDSLQRITKFSSTTRQKEGQARPQEKKNLASLKGHCLGKSNSFIFFTWDWGKRENKTIDKQMKINLAPHLATQLELIETHLLIHMVAQSDMTGTQRALSQLPTLQD